MAPSKSVHSVIHRCSMVSGEKSYPAEARHAIRAVVLIIRLSQRLQSPSDDRLNASPQAGKIACGLRS